MGRQLPSDCLWFTIFACALEGSKSPKLAFGASLFAGCQQEVSFLRTERKLRHADLTPKCTLDKVRSEALLLWRTDLGIPALLPNEFHSIRLKVPLPCDAYASAAVRQGTVFNRIGGKFVDYHRNHDRLGRVQPHIGGTLDRDAFVLLFLEGFQRLGDDGV
jgi:hypothetical protein